MIGQGHGGLPRKLTVAQVREIRAWWTQYNSMPTPAEIAQRFGLEVNRMKAIARGTNYKRVLP